jgi:glycolate oxidase
MAAPFGKVDGPAVDALRAACGAGFVLTSPGDREPYGRDETEDLWFDPEVVVRPRTTGEVAAVLRVAHARRIPVTPRAGGTGLSGGALPVRGGIVLSVDRMDSILEIDRENLVAVVESGVITQRLQEACEAVGLHYPPDPASRGSCTLGGNVAENAGGPHAAKYGVTKDFVLGVEAVLPDGRVVRWGGKLLKNRTGYSLAQLLVGSEGTLAVVTRIWLKLLPLPKVRRCMLVPFPTLESAAAGVSRIYAAGLYPAALEFMERDAVRLASEHLRIPVPGGDAEALLLVEFDGDHEAGVQADLERGGEVCLEAGAADCLLPESPSRQEDLWKVRRAIGEAVKKSSVYKEEDTVVPRAALPALVRGVKGICARAGVTAICYGHAGDGNLHCNLVRMGLDGAAWEGRLPGVVEEIFRLTISLGGTVSGEHGIGWVQRRWLPLAVSPAEMEIMRGLKRVFDPLGILNPDKVLPEEAGPGGA